MKKVEVKYQIDKGLPIPVQKRPGLPLLALEVGESIQFPTADRQRVAVQASGIFRRQGKRYTIRTEDETNARIWRTK